MVGVLAANPPGQVVQRTEMMDGQPILKPGFQLRSVQLSNDARFIEPFEQDASIIIGICFRCV
ncbi:hypothetical protein [Saccharospirillum impatiens]|uniref:hypothetical protein n=1 Tax=Saccharospirillum impatiens TaxID=169438 RepID=UPI0003FC5CA7|nr:hypothetical protein [Saccharospirillum impatiens]